MPLQRPFTGLSDHVGEYRGGNLSFDLSPAILGQISVEDFINRPDFIVSPSVTLTALNQIATTDEVPDGEIWRVRYFGFNGTNASAAIQMKPVFVYRGVTFGLSMLWPDASTSGTTAYYGMLFEGQDGFLMPPGCSLGWEWFKGGGGSITGAETIILRQRIKI